MNTPFRWATLASYAFIMLNGVMHIGEVDCDALTAGDTLAGGTILAALIWLGFRAGQESKTK